MNSSSSKASDRGSNGDKRGSTQKPSEQPITIGSQLTEVESPAPVVVSSSTKRAQSSSDYGDDDFDDLPSPSALLNGDISSAMSDGNKKENDAHEDVGIDKSVFDWDDWINDDPVEPLTPKQNETSALQPVDMMNQQIHSESPGTLGQSTAEEMDLDSRALDSFHNVEDCQPSKRTVPFMDENRNPLKRKKIQRESLSLSQEQGEIIPVERNGTNPGTNKPPSLPKDWEDIDPLLLDEFKDIVNFF